MKRAVAMAILWLAVNGISLGQARLGLHIVDSGNQKVGYFWDDAHIVIFIDDVGYKVAGTGTGFDTPAVSVFYSTPDCSGTGYFSYQDPTNYVPLAYYTSDGIFHYPSPVAPSSPSIATVLVINGDGSLGACLPSSGSGAYVPAASAAAPLLVPPFRLVEKLQVSPAPAVATFNDVPTTHPFFQFIEALYASGITAGCSAAPPLYCPDNPVTRGQMAVFLAKAFGL